MAGRNTKIAVSKVAWGVKMPFESSKVGNGYTTPGEVKVYHMSPEEIERRYGPPKKSAKPFVLNLRQKKKKSKEEEKLVAFETVPKKEKTKSAEAAPEKENHKEITVTEAIYLHDELEEEVECLDYLLTSAPVSLAPGIKLLLDERRCESAKRLHRIHEAFERTVVAV